MREDTENTITIEEPNILEAFFEFIDKYGSIPKNAIIQAYQEEMPYIQEIDIENDEKLDYSFALISLKESIAKGTQIEEITSNDDDISLSISLHKGIVEIEIFSLLQFEVQRSIQLISSMFTHPRGIEFFSAYNIAPLYVEKTNVTNSLEKESKYFSSSILCHFSYYSTIKENVNTFSNVAISLHNTDVNYV